MDELAVASGQGSVAFRKKNIENFRWLGVLEEAARLAGWDKRVSGSAVGKGRIKKGRGIAIGGFASTFAGIVAEIAVDTVTGKIRVEHVYAAHDCGLIIDPNMVGQQVEGCVDPGCEPGAHRGGQVLEEPCHLAGLGVVPDPPVQGCAGDRVHAPEPAGAALERCTRDRNRAGRRCDRERVLDATGKRIRTMPMTPARVRTALL